MSRRRIVAVDFDREAIRRRVYQLYQPKKHLTLSKLLVGKLSFVVLDAGYVYYLGFWKCGDTFTFIWQAVIAAEVAERDAVDG